MTAYKQIKNILALSPLREIKMSEVVVKCPQSGSRTTKDCMRTALRAGFRHLVWYLMVEDKDRMLQLRAAGRSPAFSSLTLSQGITI